MENKSEHRNLLSLVIKDLKSFTIEILKENESTLPNSSVVTTEQGDFVWGANVWNFDDGHSHTFKIMAKSGDGILGEDAFEVEFFSNVENNGLILVNNEEFDNIFNIDSIKNVKSEISNFISKVANDISKQDASQ